MATRLLLADDSITIQKVVGIIFSTEDYELTTVGAGDLALEKARELTPDVMLVDALMPGRNGYEVCQEVRSDALLKHIPLLLMTGAFEPFDENRARECGADDVISKPFESQHLVEKVKALLEIGKQRCAAVVPPALPVEAPRVVEAVPSFQSPEPFFAVPLESAWDEPVPVPEARFEPIPEIVTEAPFETVSPEYETAPAPFEPPAAGVEIVEAEPGDDPWGVFDLVDLEEPEPAPLVTAEPLEVSPFESETVPVSFIDIPEQGPEVSTDFGVLLGSLPGVDLEQGELQTSPFDAGDLLLQEEIVQPEQPPVLPSGNLGFEAQWEPVAEESYPYQSDELTPPGETFAIGMGEPLAMLASEPEQYFELPVVEPEPCVPLYEAPAEEIVAELSAEPVPLQGVVPTEEQLRVLLSQISREVIERIVWEVVPELAETLIKEEIRKLKQGIA